MSKYARVVKNLKNQYSGHIASNRIGGKEDGEKGSIRLPIGKWAKEWHGVVFKQSFTESIVGEERKADGVAVIADGQLRAVVIELKKSVTDREYRGQLQSSLKALCKALQQDWQDVDVRCAVVYEKRCDRKAMERQLAGPGGQVTVEFRKKADVEDVAYWSRHW